MRSDPEHPVTIHDSNSQPLPSARTTPALLLRWCLLALFTLGTGCSSMIEDKRLRELMVEKVHAC